MQLGKYRGLPIVEHSGSDAGYRSNILRFPDQRFSVITLCNAGLVDTGGLNRKVADLYLGEVFKEPAPVVASAIPLQEKQLNIWAGLWWNCVTGLYREITVDT